MSLAAPVTPTATVVFEDEFLTDKGWTGNVPTEIFVDTTRGAVSWEAHRDHPQHLAIAVPEVSGDVTFEVVGEITASINNCSIAIGLGDGVVGVGPGREPPGVYAILGWTGGGCIGHTYFADAVVVRADGTQQSTDLGAHDLCNGLYGNYLKLLPANPYRVTVRVRGLELGLEVRDAASGTLMGERTVQLQAVPARYNRLIIANYGIGDWPYATGWVDSIRVTQP